MSVQKADIKKFVNAKLLEEYTVANILDEINLILDDLSRVAKWPNLYRSNVEADRSALVSGSSPISFPSGFRVLDYIVINDGTNDGRPLKKITFKKWLKYREDESSSDYDEPLRFARRGKQWYPDPIPDGAYTAKYWFWRYHPATAGETEDILFDDEFDLVIKYGVCAEVARTHSRTIAIALWEPRYEREKQKMTPEEDRNETVARYVDI